MTLSSPYLELAAAVVGLVAGTAVVFVGPRLVAYRLDGPAAPPGVAVLVPLVGGRLAGWQAQRSAALELVTAGVFAGLAWRFGNSITLVLAAMYSAILIAIAAIDLEHRLVLNRLSYPGTLIGLAGSLWWPGIGLVNALVGALVGLVIMGVFQVIGRGALGTGDTKLALCIGAMRGIPAVLNALALGVVLGGLAAAFLWFVLRRGRKSFFAYAPYLAAGAIVSFFLPGM
jgi:prepilin signal peptidase PulO-like enzyme (type II secretory pathway)